MRIATIPAIPFGYASFRDNQSGADGLAPRERAIGLGTLAAGILAGLAFGFAGAAARRGPELATALRRLVPFDPTRRALRRAGRSGDLAAVRRAAEHHIRRRRALGRPVAGTETAALDRALHGPDGPDGLTPPAAAAGILAALRR